MLYLWGTRCISGDVINLSYADSWLIHNYRIKLMYINKRTLSTLYNDYEQ